MEDMKRTISALFLSFMLVALAPTTALAASKSTNSRYFVASTRSFWRNAMGARHVFEDGFTADLSDLQVKIAKLAGLKPVAVKKFNILAETTESASPTPQMTPSQSVSWGVRAMLDDTELKSTSGGSDILIALLDTGVERSHPDLSRRVEGCSDLVNPVESFVEGECEDVNGHGTHMAGIIVADGGPEGLGSYGFAPQASISAYRVCNATGTCFSDDIAIALNHAVDAGAQIIVLGMGGDAQSSFIHDALVYAAEHDVLVIGAAGNDGPYDDSLDWPARDPLVVSVGAVDNLRVPAEFSSRGLNADTESFVSNGGDVEFAGPGVNIESTFRDGGYAILSGTSMASSHVAGLAALVWQSTAKHPAEATRDLLHELADDIADAGDDTATGWGFPVVNAE